MSEFRPDLVRAETVRLLDVVLDGIADGRLDRAALRRLPPWRAVVLARVARRSHLMPEDELAALVEEATRVGVDGCLAGDPDAPTALDDAAAYVAVSPPPPDAPEWTQSGMIKEAVKRRRTGVDTPAVRDTSG